MVLGPSFFTTLHGSNNAFVIGSHCRCGSSAIKERHSIAYTGLRLPLVGLGTPVSEMAPVRYFRSSAIAVYDSKCRKHLGEFGVFDVIAHISSL